MKGDTVKSYDDMTPAERAQWEEETDTAVDWLTTLRQLQTDGMSFSDALAKANALFPEG